MLNTEKFIYKKIIYIFFVLTSICLFSCESYFFKESFQNKIHETCRVERKIYEIPIKDITKFNWEKCYIIDGPCFPSEVEKIIGLRYSDVINDDTKLYVFIMNNKIVQEYTFTLNNISYLHEKDYIELNYQDTLYVKAFDDFGIKRYFIKLK